MLKFFLIPLVLFAYAFPLGYLSFRQFRWRPKILYSFVFGLAFFVLLLFWITFLEFNLVFVTGAVLAIDALLFLRLRLLGIKIFEFQLKFNRHIALFFLLLLIYYSIVPLVVQYSYYRDYDLIALGIQENSAFELPWYGIRTFYPPGGSLLVAFLNLALPYSLNKIMLNLSYFFMVLVFAMLYMLGKEMKEQLLGFFICLGFLLAASSKNFLWDGSTFPGITAMLFGLLALIFVLKYAAHSDKKYFLFAAIPLAASALVHIDALLVILFGILAVLLAFRNKKLLVFILSLGIVSLLLISPFIFSSIEGKSRLQDVWAGKAWENFANDEIHPKSLSELFFYNGWPVFLFAAVGVVYLVLTRQFLLPLWLLFLLLSNSMIFLRIARPFILFYAINIIMWFGISIPLAIAAGYGFWWLHARIPCKKVFLAFVLALCLVMLVDYESFNQLGVYRRWSAGNMLWAFDNEMHFLNKGDLEIARWLANNADGLILNPNSFAGQALPVLSKKKTMQYFYHTFYNDPTNQTFIQERERDAQAIFLDKNTSLIEKNNISYIYIPSSMDSSYEYNISLLQRYKIIKRGYGAKLLSIEKAENKILHFEAEDYQTNGRLLNVEETGMTLKAVALPKMAGIRFKINNSFGSDKLMLYIKHSAYFREFPFAVKIGDWIKEIKTTAAKPTFTETSLEIDARLLRKNNGILDIVSQAPVYSIGLKNYFLIVDWIEIEEKN